MTTDQGQLFSNELQSAIKQRFHHVDHDLHGQERLFFDNAAGSFRLKSAVDTFSQIDALPDCSERQHSLSRYLQVIQAKGNDDIRLLLNATGGSVYATQSASAGMFAIVRAWSEQLVGSNVVTTVLEHPSSFDAMSQYAKKHNRELRVAQSNPETGGIDVNEITRHIDQNTAFLSVMYASNISGAKIDIKTLIQEARAIKPNLYIVVDAVQHAPHALIDLQETPVDAITIAPYKFFGCRGSGICWLSERAALLPHDKLTGKSSDFWDLGSSAPAQFAVVTAIVDYVCWLGGFNDIDTDSGRRTQFIQGMRRIEHHERALLARLLDGSDSRPGLRAMQHVSVFLDHPDLTRRDLILAIALDGIDHTAAVREYEQRGVIVYERVTSSLYSQRMLDSFALDGAIRVSPLHCHSAADIDHFLSITQEIAERANAQHSR